MNRNSLSLILFFLLLILLGAPGAAGHEVIAVGADNWERPWVPDLRNGGEPTPISLDRRIDVIILGDGYLPQERGLFEREVQAWYDRFLEYEPYRHFSGAFRVRGVWTPSRDRATPDRRSHYRLPSTSRAVGSATPQVRRAIFDAIEAIGYNPARSDGVLTHTTAVMLIRNERGRNPSGVARVIQSPDRRTRLRVAFGAYTHHEFGHSYGGLRDEYIRGPGSVSNRTQPEHVCIHSVSNIAYTDDSSRIPWRHMMPGGEINPDPNSVIGLLWPGGVVEQGAWHAEPRCLMNGTHDNWNFSMTRRGVTLRDRDNYCFWCEEILVARTLEKTGQLGSIDCGIELWQAWERIRPLYHELFGVPERIAARNAEHAQERLYAAPLVERPRVMLAGAPGIEAELEPVEAADGDQPRPGLLRRLLRIGVGER